MKRRSGVHGGVVASAGGATRAIAVLGIATVVALPIVPGTPSPPTSMRDVELAAVTVPPGGVITSFVGNQFLYCSIICPLLIETAVTAGVATLRAPITFLTAAQSGELLRAIGIAAASVTGPTNDAAQAAILADGTRVAPRALNAFEVGVVGGLGVIAAAADGLPGIVSAVQAARQDTFTAINLPVVANPTPTVTPHGVLQVAVVEIINVGAAIIFPAFNEVLSAVFDVPDAVAREFAATGKPIRAVAAGAHVAAGHLTDAVTVVTASVVNGLRNIGDRHRGVPPREPDDNDAEFGCPTTSGLVAARTRHDRHRVRRQTPGARSHVISNRRRVIEKPSERRHRTASRRPDSAADRLTQREAGTAADLAAGHRGRNPRAREVADQSAHPRMRLR